MIEDGEIIDPPSSDSDSRALQDFSPDNLEESPVQKGKFSAGAFDFVKALNRVDLPTLGSPTIPHCNDI